jgi:hypothetical protein
VSASDLSRLVEPSTARFSERFDAALLDDMMQRGDPVADRAIAVLREEAYDADGAQLSRLRELAGAGESCAVEFFERAEHRPDWLDMRLVERGQRLSLAWSRHYGLSLTHSLFAGAVFARATLVTSSTGRLGSSPARRIQETGAFVAALLEPGGLEPGALGFETAVRVRLLHGSIRSWLQRSPGFSAQYCGVPIDQTMLAMTLGLFDYLNLRSLLRLGVPLSAADVEAHHHMWRYVGYLIGIDERLLTESVEEERELWSALVAHQAFPGLFADDLLADVVGIVGNLLGLGVRRRAFVRALYLHLSGAEWFGLGDERARHPVLPALLAAGRTAGLVRRFVPGAAGLMERRGAGRLANARRMADSHGFGVKLEVDDDAEARERQFSALAAGVRRRFEPSRPAEEVLDG